jgi:hypothetical protein
VNPFGPSSTRSVCSGARSMASAPNASICKDSEHSLWDLTSFYKTAISTDSETCPSMTTEGKSSSPFC